MPSVRFGDSNGCEFSIRPLDKTSRGSETKTEPHDFVAFRNGSIRLAVDRLQKHPRVGFKALTNGQTVLVVESMPNITW